VSNDRSGRPAGTRSQQRLVLGTDAARPTGHEEDSFEFPVSISVDGMSGAARSRFHEIVQRFSEELARETSRIEEGDRAQVQGVETPEVTAATVVRAHEVCRRPAVENMVVPGTPKWVYGLRFFAFASTAAASVMGSYLNSTAQWVIFSNLSIVALISNFFVITGRRSS